MDAETAKEILNETRHFDGQDRRLETLSTDELIAVLRFVVEHDSQLMATMLDTTRDMLTSEQYLEFLERQATLDTDWLGQQYRSGAVPPGFTAFIDSL